jgi:class 3 adenylate cyclase
MESRAQPSAINVIASTLEPVMPDFGEFSSPDGALTLMFSDIENAADVLARVGDERSSDLLRDYRALVEQLVAHHDGRVVKAQDDGFMVAFMSAHAAVRCAIEMQRTFATRVLSWLEEPLRLRAGLHTGFVIANADEFYGRNVVLAARIADRAGGGEILVSSALKEYTETDPTLRFESRGEFHFKGLVGEHAVHVVQWGD